jgi:hypothetical protein
VRYENRLSNRLIQLCCTEREMELVKRLRHWSNRTIETKSHITMQDTCDAGTVWSRVLAEYGRFPTFCVTSSSLCISLGICREPTSAKREDRGVFLPLDDAGRLGT